MFIFQGYKGIKKWSKILLIVFLSLCGVGVGGYYLLITKPVQNLVGQKILNQIARKTNTTISASRLSFFKFKHLKIKDLYIEDQAGDTLVYAPLAIAHLDSLNTKDRFIKISHLELRNANFNIKEYSAKHYNFSFIIDSLHHPEPPNPLRWHVEVGHIALKDNALNVFPYQSDSVKLKQISTQVILENQTVAINQLSFKMGNGFELDRLETKLSFNDTLLEIPTLSVVTPKSSLIFRDIALASGVTGWSSTPKDSLTLRLQSNQSYISAQDLNYFIPQKYHIADDLVLDGRLSGNLAHITGDNIYFNIDNTIDFKGDFILEHLLEASKMAYSINIDTLNANVNEVAHYYNHITEKALEVDKLNHWGDVTYSGVLDGNRKDIVLRGELSSKYGRVSPSFIFHLADSTRFFSYTGDVKSSSFYLGAALNNDNAFDRIVVDAHLQGQQHEGGIMHYFLAQIPHVDYNKYKYHNVEVEGILDTNYVNSVFSINDPNAHAIFSGEINFNKKKPSYLFSLMASKLDLAALHFVPDYEKFVVRFDSYTQLEGSSIDNLNGSSDFYQFTIATESGEFQTDSLHFTFSPKNAQPSITLESDYINAELVGSYNFAELPGFINQSLNGHMRHLPVLFEQAQDKVPNDFKFNIQIADLYELAEAIDFPIIANGNTLIEGQLNSKLNTFNVDVAIPYLMTQSQLLDSISIALDQNYACLKTDIEVEQMSFIGDHLIKDFAIQSNLKRDTLEFNVDWFNGDLQKITDFNSNVFLMPYGRQLMTVLDIKPSTFVLSDATWDMDSSTVTLIKDRLHVADFRLHNGNGHLMADGIFSTNPNDTLFFDLDNFELGHLDQFLKIKNTSFSGLMSGDAALYRLGENPAMNAQIEIENTRFNGADWGDIVINSIWDDANEALGVDIKSSIDSVLAMSIAGLYYPEIDSLDAIADFSGFTIDFLQPYLAHTLNDIDGGMYGQVDVVGALASPQLYGAVKVKDGFFRVDYLSADFEINDSIYFDDHQFILKNTKVQDQENNIAIADGVISHKNYRDMDVDLRLYSDRFLALNNNAEENEYFFGDIYYGGLITISSTEKETRIGSTARTMKGSSLTVPLSPVSVANTNNFIRYKQIEEEQPIVDRRKQLKLEEVYVPKRKLVIDMDFEITEDALVKLEFNSESGDIIKGIGNGNLNMQFEHGQPFQMFGEYEITKGEYLFSLQQLFNKRFDIVAGSTMRWSGAPGNAVMDITGRYSTKASLYNLMPDAIGETNKNRRVPVNVKLMLQGLLSQPDIIFDIELPSTNEQTQQSVSSIINTEDEMSRQVLSLLIMNSFYTPEYYTDANSPSTQPNNQISNVAAVTASEFLSNQLSNWMSQIYSNVDLGFYYMPGQEISDKGMSPQEYEMAISSQFFNDRLVVNGNVGYQNYTNGVRPPNLNNNFIGEIDVELKLNDNLRLKAYSHQNDDILYETSSLKQGVGISYQEDFEDIKELRQRYKQRIRKLFSKKDKPNSEAIERKEEELTEEKE